MKRCLLIIIAAACGACSGSTTGTTKNTASNTPYCHAVPDASQPIVAVESAIQADVASFTAQVYPELVEEGVEIVLEMGALYPSLGPEACQPVLALGEEHTAWRPVPSLPAGASCTPPEGEMIDDTLESAFDVSYLEEDAPTLWAFPGENAPLLLELGHTARLWVHDSAQKCWVSVELGESASVETSVEDILKELDLAISDNGGEDVMSSDSDGAGRAWSGELATLSGIAGVTYADYDHGASVDESELDECTLVGEGWDGSYRREWRLSSAQDPSETVVLAEWDAWESGHDTYTMCPPGMEDE